MQKKQRLIVYRVKIRDAIPKSLFNQSLRLIKGREINPIVENNKFKKLAEVSLSGESCAVRGLYIDNYFYIVTLGKDVKVLDLNNYKVVKKLK